MWRGEYRLVESWSIGNMRWMKRRYGGGIILCMMRYIGVLCWCMYHGRGIGDGTSDGG